MSNRWFAMGTHYGEYQSPDNWFVWPIFRDNGIACNGYSRGLRQDIDDILDEISRGDFVVVKSANQQGMYVYGIGEVIWTNSYPCPSPEGYQNQCLKLNWIIRNTSDNYVKHFPSLVGGKYTHQLLELDNSAIKTIRQWMNDIGINC